MGNQGRNWNLSILIIEEGVQILTLLNSYIMAGILEMTGRGIRCGDIVMCPEMEEMKIS